MMQKADNSLKMTSLCGLVKAHWGRSSNFMTGINFYGESGELWTSLALKKEVTQRKFSLNKNRVNVDNELFQVIPSWVKSLTSFEDIHLDLNFDNIPEGCPRKDILDFIFIGTEITKAEFYFIFSNCCLRNSSAFFFQHSDRIKLPLNRSFSLPSGELYVVSREEFNQWIDHLSEVS